jgi:molybdopterin-containing oxidoreductase family membrane subunit
MKTNTAEYLEPEPHPSDRLTYDQVTQEVVAPLERLPGMGWWAVFGGALCLLMVGVVSVYKLVTTGIGVWGLNNSIGWAFDITNFVFWIGIGHAGTLISAILFLFRQKWRTAINRSAEAMTIFAVMTAGIFPILHTGRPWLAFWLFPYPNTHGSLWVNFRSPLLWDVFAVSTYFTISAVFWFIGLIPDLATVRDRCKDKIRHTIYKILSMGWTGSMRNWMHYEMTYMILAALSTPLVLSVHSIVSFDFAVSVVPGWHTTIFPPYFVAGAIFSGFAMVMTLLIIVRKVLHLEDYITVRHLENMCKIIMATGLMVGYAYASEFFIAWYSGSPFERFAFINRAFGPYAWAYWIMVSCNVFIPQVFWWKKMRTNLTVMFIISIFVNIGMWFERFVIIVTSLHRGYLPSEWSYFSPTIWDIGLLIGSFGFFFTFFLLFTRILPVIAMAEIKSILPFKFKGGKAYGTHEDVV